MVIQKLANDKCLFCLEKIEDKLMYQCHGTQNLLVIFLKKINSSLS